MTLRLEGRPRRGPDGAQAAVAVAINGRPAGRLELGPGRREHGLELPAGLFVGGDNRLRLSYELDGGETPPPGEERRIAVAFIVVNVIATRPRSSAAWGERSRGRLPR